MKKQYVIWALFIILMAGMISAGVYLVISLEKKALKASTEDIKKHVRILAHTAKNIEGLAIADISYLGEMEIFQKGPSPRIRKRLKRYFSKYKFIISNIIWRTKEKTLLNINLSDQNNCSFSSKPALPLSLLPYRATKGYGNLESEGRQKLFFITPVTSKAGTLSNLIIVFSPEKLFHHITEHTHTGKAARIWVIDLERDYKKGGTLLPSKRAFNLAGPRFKGFLEDANKGFEGTGLFTNIGQKGSDQKKAQEYIAAYYPFKIIKRKYCIGIFKNKNDVLHNIRQTNLIIGILSLLTIAILSSLFLIIFYREKNNLQIQARLSGQLESTNFDLEKVIKKLTNEIDYSERLINSQSDMVIVCDKYAIITKVNDATLSALGYFREELKGMPLEKIVKGNDDLTMARNKALKGTRVNDFETTFITKEKDNIIVSLNSAILFNDKGIMIGAIGVARDIRERKKMQDQLRDYAVNLEKMVEERTKELKEKEGQLIQSGKLASLGEMATGIAHEINQPLNVIKMTATGMLHFLKKGKTISSEMLKEDLEITDGQIERIRKIINHMRTFARKSGEIITEEVDLNIPINDSLSFIKEQLRMHEIMIDYSFAESMPKVMADANKLEQVFLNILTNAKDAMETEHARKKAEGHDGPADYRKLLKIRSYSENGRAIVSISDTGGGIPKEARKKIFEPFFTTKEIGKGTGLGMSISYNIIKDFKGSLDFEVEEGVGTTFKVELPI